MLIFKVPTAVLERNGNFYMDKSMASQTWTVVPQDSAVDIGGRGGGGCVYAELFMLCGDKIAETTVIDFFF